MSSQSTENIKDTKTDVDHIRRSKRQCRKRQYCVTRRSSVQPRVQSTIMCPYCNSTFTSSKPFVNHALSEHPCFVQRVSAQQKKSTYLVYKCQYCNVTRYKAKIIRLHMVRIHTCEYDPAVVGRLKRYPCAQEQCVRTFFTKQEANFHSRHCDARQTKEWEHTVMLTSNHRSTRLRNCYDTCKEIAGADKPFECGVCHKQFREHWVTVKHENEHFRRDKQYPKLQVGGTKFTCPHCERSFHRRQYLEDHVAFRHNGVIKYMCSICEEAFASCTVYCRHMNSKHPELGDSWKKRKKLPHSRIVGIGSGGETHKCQVCSGIFASALEVERHMGIHDKSYMCQTCNKTFCNKTTLNNHTHIHEGLRPFDCRYCEKTFRSKSNRYQHEQIHKGEKGHICPICHQGFTVQSTLRNHLYKYQKHGIVPFPEQKLVHLIEDGEFVLTRSADDDYWADGKSPSGKKGRGMDILHFSDAQVRRSLRSKKESTSQICYDELYDDVLEPAIISVKNETIYDKPVVEQPSSENSKETNDVGLLNEENRLEKTFTPDDFVNKPIIKSESTGSFVEKSESKEECTDKDAKKKRLSLVMQALRKQLLGKQEAASLSKCSQSEQKTTNLETVQRLRNVSKTFKTDMKHNIDPYSGSNVSAISNLFRAVQMKQLHEAVSPSNNSKQLSNKISQSRRTLLDKEMGSLKRIKQTQKSANVQPPRKTDKPLPLLLPKPMTAPIAPARLVTMPKLSAKRQNSSKRPSTLGQRAETNVLSLGMINVDISNRSHDTPDVISRLSPGGHSISCMSIMDAMMARHGNQGNTTDTRTTDVRETESRASHVIVTCGDALDRR